MITRLPAVVLLIPTLMPATGTIRILTAVQEQLGLTLEPRMSPNDVDALVVDSVELPTPN